MANPSTIMGAAALDYWDIDDAGSLWQNSDGTTGVVDGNPVGRWSGQLATRNLTQPDDTSARPLYEETAQAHLLFDGANDWLEDTAGYTGAEFYFIGRVYVATSAPDGSRIIQCSNDFAGDGSPGAINTFITGTEIGVILDGFGFLLSPTFPRDQWFTLEIGFSGTEYLIGVDGATTSGSGTGTAPDFDRMTLAANRQSLSAANITPMRLARVSTLTALPDSTERTALQDWAENGDVGGAGEITGTLTAQETGSDAASASVEVVVSGTVAAQESGADGAVASATAGVAAALAGQEAGSDLATATGAVGLEAALAAQEAGADSAAASASVAVGITISAQETGPDLASGSATVAVAGAVAAQEAGSDGAAVSGAVAVAGALAALEAGSDGASGSASVAVAGAVAAQEAGGDAAAVSGAVAVEGALAAQESGADRAVIQAGSGRIVSLSAQEAGSDQAEGSAAVEVAAALVTQEMGGDIASVIVSIEDNVITVNLAAREAGSDAGSGAASVAVAAAAFAQEQGADGAEILSNVVILASAALSETGTDRASIVVQNSVPTPSARRAATPAQSANGGRLTVTANGGRLIQSRNGGRLV